MQDEELQFQYVIRETTVVAVAPIPVETTPLNVQQPTPYSNHSTKYTYDEDCDCGCLNDCCSDCCNSLGFCCYGICGECLVYIVGCGIYLACCGICCCLCFNFMKTHPAP